MIQIMIDKNTHKYQVIGVGRLSLEKDFIVLIKAFNLVRKEVDARLVILGKGSELGNIENCIKKYKLGHLVFTPGFVDNPWLYIKRSDVLCVSSISEGFGNVIVEALALDVPVVSTDCPSGPREILENGLYGKLTPVGDYKKMANAIVDTWVYGGTIPSREYLVNRFGVSNIADKYLEVLLDDK